MAYTPGTGRMLREDGTTMNFADIIGGTDTGLKADIDKMAPRTGRFVREDGSVVNIADVFADWLAGLGTGGAGGGGTVSLKELTVTVDDKSYKYNGKTAVGETQYTYDGQTPVTIEIPKQEPVTNKALNISIGGQSYSYDGSAEVDISIPAAEGVEF